MLHGNNWETKWDVSDLSDHTPAAKGNVGLLHAKTLHFFFISFRFYEGIFFKSFI